MLLEYLTLYLSALDFSQFIKVSRFRAVNYELGNRNPKQDTVDAIADVLNVNPAYLTNSDMQDIDSFLIQLFQIDDNFPISVQNSVDEYGNNHYGLYFSSAMINTLLSIWHNQQQGVINGTINKSDYVEWKMNYLYDMGRST